MNQLIPIHQNESDHPMVSGRDLHEFLEVVTRYNDWFPRMAEYGFDEGKDYYSKVSNGDGFGKAATRIDHMVTLTMAKEICMIQRSDKGKLARQYFLKLEEAWNTPEMVMARALKMADRQIEQLTAKIEHQKPLVQFAETCLESKDSLLIGDFAKVLNKDGFNIGEIRLFQLLREWKMLYRNEGRNIPYQRYVDARYFEVTEKPYKVGDDTRTSLTVRVTPKGQAYIINRLSA